MSGSSLRRTADFWALMPFGKAIQREQVLAATRLVIALAFVAILRLVVSPGPHDNQAAWLVLLGYFFYSLIVFLRIFLVSDISSTLLLTVHAADLAWPSVICLFTGCSHSPFFLLYVFALIATPYRRKGVETLLIAVCSILILLTEDMLVRTAAFSWLHVASQPLHLNRFAIKAAILILLSGLLAYMAWWNQREQQAFATRSILRRLRADAAFQTNLREILPAILRIFESRKVVLVLRNSSSWRVFEWGSQHSHEDHTQYRDLPASEEERYFWPMPGTAWSLACRKGARGDEWLTLSRDGTRGPVFRQTGGAPLWDGPYRTLLATSLRFGTEWSGRLFVVDPRCSADPEECLRLLQQVVSEVGPAVYNFYLWRHTSVRVRALERQRIARDLHDGVVQSLIATEMHLDVLRRQSIREEQAVNVGTVLQEAQESLRAEVRKLRGEIERLRSSGVPRPVLPRVADMLQSFQRETGILTTYSCNVQEQLIPRNISDEMGRILEEALSNVRRHSGAQKVDVRLAARQDSWEFVIQDDGKGFGFSGRLSLAQLDAARLGPRVIRERVHSINGDLALESWPNRGARMEIRFAANC